MTAIAGAGDDLVAVGYDGVLFQTTKDMRWEKVATDLDWTRSLDAVWVSPDGDVFVVGDAGVILRRR